MITPEEEFAQVLKQLPMQDRAQVFVRLNEYRRMLAEGGAVESMAFAIAGAEYSGQIKPQIERWWEQWS